MNNSEELKLLIIFSLLAAINLMVLFLILFFKKNNTLSTKVLGLLIFIPSVVLVLNPLLYSKYFSGYLFIVFLALSIPFLFGPLLLLYIHLVKGNTYLFKKKNIFHFFPVYVISIYGLYISLQSDEFLHENYQAIVSGEHWVMNFIYLAQLIHFAVYITVGIKKVNLFKTKTYMSIIDKTNYSWLNFFVTRLLYLNILLLLIYVVQMSFFPDYMMYSDLLATPLASTCFYPIMVYKSFLNRIDGEKKINKDEIKSKSFQVSKLDTMIQEKTPNENIEDSQYISKLIQNKIKNDKSYLKLDYTIFDLSKELKLPQKTLSDIINKEIGTSFLDLINEYRVQESKLILIDKSKSLTIDAIAELSGFKSRATFYRVFKDKTKITPTQYIKKFKTVS